MARVKLLSDADGADHADLLERIRGARRGRVINIYRLLLHAPPLAAAWFELINAVRWKTGLSGRLREIVIIRIGHLTGTAYIVNQHVPKLAEQEGLTRAECDALAHGPAPTFSPAEVAALHYAEAMTRDVAVDDPTFDALGPYFGEKEIVELSVLVGTYNMHARVLTALRIDPEPADGSKA